MDSNYLKELEEEIQKRKAEAELQFNKAKISSQKSDLKDSKNQLDLDEENNLEKEQEDLGQSHENNPEEQDEDNDIVNEGIKSLSDEKKEENNINFELNEEKNGENINYEIQDINEPKNDLNYPNLISMNQSNICQCCNKEFDNNKNIPCMLKCKHIFCKMCLETYFTEKEGIKCPIDGLVGKDLNDVQIVNALIDKKEKKDKKKKKKKNKDEADDEEEEEKEVLTIIYDKKSFGKYYETLKKEIMGNFTNFDIVDQEYPLPANKKFFSKITFFTQMGVSLLIFSGQKLKDKLTIIPSAVFDGIEKNKWFVMIGNFLLHQWLNKNLSTTGAFEIYYKDRIIFSKLATNKLPKETDIHKEIKRINKRIKGKNKKKKYEEDYDDDEDL